MMLAQKFIIKYAEKYTQLTTQPFFDIILLTFDKEGRPRRVGPHFVSKGVFLKIQQQFTLFGYGVFL